MMRMTEYSDRFDKVINSVLGGIGSGQIVLSVLTAANGNPVWISALTALSGGFCLWTCGWRMHRRFYNQIQALAHEEMQARVPQKILFQTNEDESVTAFVTMLNGDPVMVEIPAEIVAQGRQAAQTWLLDTLMLRGE